MVHKAHFWNMMPIPRPDPAPGVSDIATGLAERETVLILALVRFSLTAVTFRTIGT